jgi:translation initiation factor IF-3
VNERIRAPKLRVIDGTTNKQLGVMASYEALQVAKKMGLDLVEVSANADPPVCRICDYGKFKYDEAKKKKESTTKTTKIKEVKFRIGIDPHDYGIKMTRAERFLMHGDKLRIQLMFRGRQMAHQELGFELAKQITDDLATMAHVDMEPRKTGRNITMMLSPLPEAQRKPKFLAHDDDLHPDDDEDPLEEDDEGEGDDAQQEDEQQEVHAESES